MLRRWPCWPCAGVCPKGVSKRCLQLQTPHSKMRAEPCDYVSAPPLLCFYFSVSVLVCEAKLAGQGQHKGSVCAGHGTVLGGMHVHIQTCTHTCQKQRLIVDSQPSWVHPLQSHIVSHFAFPFLFSLIFFFCYCISFCLAFLRCILKCSSWCSQLFFISTKIHHFLSATSRFKHCHFLCPLTITCDSLLLMSSWIVLPCPLSVVIREHETS